MILVIINCVLIYSNGDDKQEKEEENISKPEIYDELEVTPNTTWNPKVVREMKNLQGKTRKSCNEKFNFLINLATNIMVADDKVTTKEEPKTTQWSLETF